MDNWIRCEKIGQGSFATVSLAVSKDQSNTALPPLMAVKSTGVLYSSTLKQEKMILDELKGCPEVIQCYGESSTFENGEKLYNVLLEYAPGGSLSEKVSGKLMPEIEVKKYTKALLKGLEYIHKMGYAHCDVKLQNMLIGQDGKLKIADFGLAKRVGSKNSGYEFRGTPLYMSPEVVMGKEIGAAADVWAVGCAVAEMVTGVPAWQYSDLAELLMRIGVGEEVPAVPESLCEEGKDFLMKCFVKDPEARWTAEMLLNHPFVSGCELDELVCEEYKPSPRCPFDFPDWGSSSEEESSSWFSENPFAETGSDCDSMSPAERLRGLVCDQRPDWSGEWVTVR